MHVPAGATPKDGPSAGITLVASLYSLIRNTPLPKGLAMTGEITLSGRVLPVGGIKEKLLAAKRSGIHTVLLPKDCDRDLQKLDAETKAGLKLIKISTVREIIRCCLHHSKLDYFAFAFVIFIPRSYTGWTMSQGGWSWWHDPGGHLHNAKMLIAQMGVQPTRF